MNQYVHLNPNFGKYKIIPILLVLPIIVFLFVYASLEKKINTGSGSHSEVLVYESKNILKINDVDIYVEIADTESKRSSGLSNRPPLEDKEGMLFVFPQNDIKPIFWMKDMYFDIDIIWINDGIVSEIHSNVARSNEGTTVEDLIRYTPEHEIDYVLKMNAGSAQKYGIEVGDTVTIPTL